MLNQTEREIFELSRKKADISRVLKMVVDKETLANQTLVSLDIKIKEMYKEAVSFENKFRAVKGDSTALLNRDNLDNEVDDCLMV